MTFLTMALDGLRQSNGKPAGPRNNDRPRGRDAVSNHPQPG